MRYFDTKKYIVVLFVAIAILIVSSLAFADILIPNDPLFDTWDEDNPQGNNWGQEFIKLPSAWNIETGSATIKVAVVDDGFAVDHEDLKENIDIIGPMNIVRSHGSHVAGIIGAKGNNEKGIAGTMWNSGLFLHSTVIPGSLPLLGDRYDSLAVLNAMKIAIIEGAQIVHFSAGTTSKTPEKAEEQKRAWKELMFRWVEEEKEDVLFIFAAGNDRKDFSYTSPANLSQEYDNIISVAANDQNGELARWLVLWGSNYGEVTVAAPGKAIYSTIPGDNYGEETGTSMAAPFVSGLAGLIYSKAEELGETFTAAEVKDLIVQGAVNGNKYVSGPDEHQIPIINAYESLKLLVAPPPPEWSLPETIYSSPEGIIYRAITSDNSGNLHMIWTKLVWKDTWYTEIYYTKRDETGWSEPIIIFSFMGGAGGQPDILSDSLGNLHIVFAGRQDNTNTALYMMYDGIEWSKPLNISNTFGDPWYLIRITSDNNDNLHVVWSHLSAAPTVFYVNKTNGIWSEPLAISPPAAAAYCGSLFPLIVSDSNNYLHVVMHTCLSASSSVYSLFYTKFNGTEWSEPISLNISSSGNSGGADYGLTVDEFNHPHIIASSRISGKWGMYHIYWDGSNWTSPNDISGTENYVELASITTDNLGVIYGIWREDVTEQGSQVVYSSYNGNIWSEPEIIPNIPVQCAPIDVVADIFNHIHVIYSYIQEGIYYFSHIWR